METNEVKKLKDAEIVEETSRLRRALFDLRAQVVTDKVKDTSQFRKLRGDLARVLTEASARRRTAQSSAGVPQAGRGRRKVHS